MNIEAVVGFIVLAISLIGGAAGWSQIKKHGATNEKLKRIKRERNEAVERERESNYSDLNDDQRDDFIDRL